MEVKRFGKYELMECLGRGGMGEVWKARDSQLQRFVAVKLLHANFQADPDFIAHFMREAQFIASLHHPNIVQVHDFQFITEQDSEVKAYMVMDYIEGGTLADYIRHTSRKGLFPSATDIVHILTGLSLALDHAHQRGMIHRDIKPANILLDKTNTAHNSIGEPVLTDFGIARLQNTNASTLTNAMLGTPLYISPEQARNQPISGSSDLYSLGIVLYELLTGVTPFRGDSPVTIMMQHAYEMPTPPALINPTISSALSAVVLQAISKDPMARFPTAIAMTMAVTQAFNLPVPALLDRPGHIHEHAANSSLLQQSSNPLPGMSTHNFMHSGTSFPLLTPSPSDTPDIQTDSSTSTRKSESYVITYSSGLANTPATPADPRLHNTQEYSPPQTVGSPYQQQPSSKPPVHPSPPGRKSVFIALTIGILLLLIGAGTFAVYPSLFSKKSLSATPTATSSAVVGYITFVSSQNASYNTFDQLQIDLENIPAPSGGLVYYAWLENSGETGVYPHWQLQLSNGSLHKLYSSTSQNADLYTLSNLFLITEESASNTPIVPMPDPSRIYYAIITHQPSSSPRFEVMQCPSSGATGSGSPCM